MKNENIWKDPPTGSFLRPPCLYINKSKRRFANSSYQIIWRRIINQRRATFYVRHKKNHKYITCSLMRSGFTNIHRVKCRYNFFYRSRQLCRGWRRIKWILLFIWRIVQITYTWKDQGKFTINEEFLLKDSFSSNCTLKQQYIWRIFDPVFTISCNTLRVDHQKKIVNFLSKFGSFSSSIAPTNINEEANVERSIIVNYCKERLLHKMKKRISRRKTCYLIWLMSKDNRSQQRWSI